MVARRRFLLGAALLAGVCAAGCAPHDTGVLLTINGEGITPDQLEVVATYDGITISHGVPDMPGPLTLPFRFLATLPNHSTSAYFTVTATAGGAWLASGSTPPLEIEPRQVVDVTVDLSSQDAGTQQPPADAGSTD